jgi:hypothetical protein
MGLADTTDFLSSGLQAGLKAFGEAINKSGLRKQSKNDLADGARSAAVPTGNSPSLPSTGGRQLARTTFPYFGNLPPNVPMGIDC